jgi:hypothetical protein
MPRDFRKSRFAVNRVEACGQYIGDRSYWKLYTIENTLRVVISSVLSAQLGPDWWSNVWDKKKDKTLQRFRNQYTSKPKHASPGRHDIYLVFLSDLNQIIRIQSNQFRTLIPDLDRWIVRLEGIRLPRNLVGHMNFPNYYDQQRINKTHDRLSELLGRLRKKNIPIVIP